MSCVMMFSIYPKFSTPYSFLFDAKKDDYHQNVTFGISHKNFVFIQGQGKTVWKQHRE